MGLGYQEGTGFSDSLISWKELKEAESIKDILISLNYLQSFLQVNYIKLGTSGY